MDTEHPSPRYSDIDIWEPSDIAEAMIEGQFTAVAAVRSARVALVQAALATEARLRNGGRLVYVGAGTSGPAGRPGRRRARFRRSAGRKIGCCCSWPAAGMRCCGRWKGPRTRSIKPSGSCSSTTSAPTTSSLPSRRAEPRRSPCPACGTQERRGALTVGVANNRDTPILQEADHADLARHRRGADCRLDAHESRNGAADYPERLVVPGHDLARPGL